ncbi:DNA repair protein RecO, partial [Candidatus Roizmanbacteria bacterium]|nr:DNA repair protein RecO [Candidatus Roizmanbacteria bacterium]
MKRTIKTEAIVLRKRSLPNQDTIVTLFSKKIGKVNAFAKGIKKITSRRLPHVQTANLINAVLYK